MEMLEINRVARLVSSLKVWAIAAVAAAMTLTASPARAQEETPGPVERCVARVAQITAGTVESIQGATRGTVGLIARLDQEGAPAEAIAAVRRAGEAALGRIAGAKARNSAVIRSAAERALAG
ncbi:MAG: hypothetical protein AAFR38_09805 [Planctomycetota bacterium]